MNQNVKYGVLWFLELLIIMFLSISSGLFMSHTLHQSLDNVSHTNQVIDQIDRVFIINLRAENSVKAYIALGNPEYMKYYEELKLEYPSAYADLQYLVQGNPTQRKNLEDFSKAVMNKYRFSQEILRLYRDKKLDPALSIKLEGKKLTDKIADVYYRMKSEEYRILENRTTDLENQVFYMTFLVPLLVLISFVAIVVSYFTIKNDQ